MPYAEKDNNVGQQHSHGFIIECFRCGKPGHYAIKLSCTSNYRTHAGSNATTKPASTATATATTT